MKSEVASQRPQLKLQEWARSNDQLPAQCLVENISYPALGEQALAMKEENHFWFIIRRRLVLDQLKKRIKPGAHGLDIGCGSGFNTEWLSNQGYPTLGIDAHKISRSTSSKSLGFLQGDIFSVDPLPEFDFITMLDVVEHIENDQKFLEHALKFVKPGGFVVMTTPAFMSLWSSVDDISGHYRRYTRSTMKSLAESVNAKIEKQFYFYGLLLPLYILSRLMTKFRPAEKISSTESMPSNFMNSILNLILKIERKFVYLGGLPVGSSLFTIVSRKV